MAAIWEWLAAWFWARTRQFWVTVAFGGGCFLAGGCACIEINAWRPHWIFKTPLKHLMAYPPSESPEPPLADQKVKCTECKGTGRVDGQPCMLCPGTGKIIDSKGVEHVCVMCQGTGKRFGECPMCGGSGELYRDGPGILRNHPVQPSH